MEGALTSISHKAVDLLAASDYLAVVFFFESKGVGSRLAISIARSASFFAEDKSESKTFYLVGFKKTERDATRLLALMPIVSGWRGTMMFMKGRPMRWEWRIQQVIECYVKSFSHTHQEDYCKSVYEYGGPIVTSVISIRMPGELVFQQPEQEQRPFLILPCRQMTGWKIREAKEAPDKKSQILSHAIEQNIDVCPMFDVDRYKDYPCGHCER
ncbi:hypothetical protein [Tepidicella xavieri]|uniref:hypothetical protein n=1 Tax=Tepidicella xavieri TaxID=360241 RepID=UPI00105F09E5|nr:hypothetical protein [Tepidicella xavieri]